MPRGDYGVGYAPPISRADGKAAPAAPKPAARTQTLTEERGSP